MSQIETAQYILDEFHQRGLRAISVIIESEPNTATILTDGSPVRVTGLFAARLKP